MKAVLTILVLLLAGGAVLGHPEILPVVEAGADTVPSLASDSEPSTQTDALTPLVRSSRTGVRYGLPTVRGSFAPASGATAPFLTIHSVSTAQSAECQAIPRPEVHARFARPPSLA